MKLTKVIPFFPKLVWNNLSKIMIMIMIMMMMMMIIIIIIIIIKHEIKNAQETGSLGASNNMLCS